MTAPAARRSFLPYLIGALVLAGAGAAYLLRPPPPLTVDVVRVGRGEVRELIPSAAAGEVRPARRVTVRAELAGTVDQVAKKKGARVAEGELVLQFTSDELEARVSQAKANVEAAQVAVRIADTRKLTTERSLVRARKLKASEAISEVELEKVETEASAAREAVQQARATEKQSQASLQLAEVTRNRATVRAPFAGVLQEVQAEVGVQLAPGAPLFDLIDDSSVRVDVPVDEADVPRIAVDQTVLLYVGGRREQPIMGRVRFIPTAMGRAGPPGLEGAPIASKERALYIEVTPEGSDRLRIGASVNAELLVSAKEDVTYVPTQAVIGRGRERAVFRVDGKKARRVPFEAGLTSWERTEVKSGLQVGDRLITSLNLKGLEDGALVVVKSEDALVGGVP